jgi:hypothetical protein
MISSHLSHSSVLPLYRGLVPSPLHEAWVEIFRTDPDLAARRAAALGVRLPAYAAARPAPGEYCDIRPSGVRADAPIVLYDEAEKPLFSIVMEIQLGRDDEKRRSWPLYSAALHHRLRCPVMTIVACPAPLVGWCARTLHVGPHHKMTPHVNGLDWVPMIIDSAEAADNPTAAALSAMGHGDGPHRSSVLTAFVDGLKAVEADQAPFIIDIVQSALCAAARLELEKLVSATFDYDRPLSTWGMTFFDKGHAEGHAEGEVKGFIEGQAKGEAKALLLVLATRGIEVSDMTRLRVLGCTDVPQLETWTRRAVTATTADDVFID